MKRREFITLVGGAVVNWPLAARAQQPTMPVIGWLGYTTFEKIPDIIATVERGLAESDFIEGSNFKFEYRFAEFHPERLPALAAELVQRQVDLIIMFALPPSGVRAMSKSVPIVFFLGGDPVKGGLVDSLNKPGGNITGVTVLNVELTGKRLELLHELIPAARLIGYLSSPVSAGSEKNELQAAARALGLQLLELIVESTGKFASAFAALAQANVGGVIVGQDSVFQRNSDQIVALAARHRIPAIYASRISATAGGLISYGTSYQDAYRIIGSYAGRILKGEKPADLPVQQVSKIETVINLNTAKALGFDIPATILARADEVIE
jgi:putative ABC transport system substrate-binding protein